MANASNFLKNVQLFPWADEHIGSCSICLIVYDEIRVPKLLCCGHTFCFHCIESLTTQQTIIKCPTCRHETNTTLSPLPTNYELTEVLGKLAEMEAESKKSEVVCQECFSAVALQKARYCKSCNLSNSAKICSDCCVENHNGHELVVLIKFFEQQRAELIDTVEEHKGAITSLQAKIENQQADIALLLAKIQSLVHARQETFSREATSIAHDLNHADAEIDLEMLQQQKFSEYEHFSLTEEALNKIVTLNEKMLEIGTAAINKLDRTAARERSSCIEENFFSLSLDDNGQTATNSELHSCVEEPQDGAAAKCNAEDEELISLRNEVPPFEEPTAYCNEGHEQVVVSYNYEAQHDDELTIHLGQLIDVIEKPEENWWKGRLMDGRQGFFPSNFVKPFAPSVS